MKEFVTAFKARISLHKYVNTPTQNSPEVQIWKQASRKSEKRYEIRAYPRESLIKAIPSPAA